MERRGIEPPIDRRPSSTPRYKQFQKTYFDDWVAFIYDCFEWREGEGPAQYQEEIISGLLEHKREAVRGPHTLGKTALASWCILAFALTRDGSDWKLPTTASSWYQLSYYLWPEVHKWARRLKWDKIGRPPFDPRRELLTNALKLDTGMAFAISAGKPAAMEGAHADHMLYVFDEAKTIPDGLFDAVEGAFAGAGPDTMQDALALAISTPGAPGGRFFDIHSRKPGFEDWLVRHVTKDDAIAAGRMSTHWAEQRKRQWGEESAVYKNRVLGEFAVSGEEVVIPMHLVDRAHELWKEWKHAGLLGQFNRVGVDVGGGVDPSMLALRYDDIPRIETFDGLGAPITIDLWSGVKEIRKMTTADPIKVGDAVIAVLDAHGGYAVVDSIGIGAGTLYHIRQEGHTAKAFNAGEATKATDKSEEMSFIDKRSAAWWQFRELLEEGGVALPPDEEIDPDGVVSLVRELTTPKWDRTKRGVVFVESKKDLRKADRLGHSTDAADSVIQAYWQEPKIDGWVANY